MAKRTRKQIIIDTTNNQIVDMMDEGGMIYAPHVLETITESVVLIDGLHKNINNDAGKCIRCNRRIMNNASYHLHKGLVLGLECINFFKAVEGTVAENEVVEVVQRQFRLRMRELTIAGMKKKKGLIKDKTPSITSDAVEQLLSMGM
jgi:hypothetical protein